MEGPSRKKLSVEEKAILITGCSSGIGRVTAIKLAEYGFTVFATVRKESGVEDLSKLSIPGLIPVFPLDLTDHEQITNTSKIVSNELNNRNIKGLYALINNAGRGSPAPVELMSLDKFHIELQTRILGSVAMVQEFLPLIRKANGRIIWIMTPALIPTPYVTSIHACDFAINCIARTLDIELKSWNIPNIMIKCGGIKTPAGFRTSSDVEAVLRNNSNEKTSLYEKALRKWANEMMEFDKKRTNPEKVSETILKSLIAKQPKRRYSVGYMSGAARILETLPQPLTDWILKKRF